MKLEQVKMECKVCEDISKIVFLRDRVECQICVKSKMQSKMQQTQQVARNVAQGKLMNIANNARVKAQVKARVKVNKYTRAHSTSESE